MQNIHFSQRIIYTTTTSLLLLQLHQYKAHPIMKKNVYII